jgi:Na+-transporting NADH:ubiquinone oxidoreductase subunit A
MSEVIKIKRGLDVKLQGKAETVFGHSDLPDFFALKPTDFHGLTPKLAVKEGDEVKAGTVLFYDKYRTEIKFVSPVSGIIQAINRGERRKLLEVVVKNDKTDSAVQFGVADPNSLSKEAVIAKMLEAGLWPFIKQRPYDVIANPLDTPKAIFISAFDSAPLAPDSDFVTNGQEKYLQAGVDALKKLCNAVHIGLNADAASKAFTHLKGVEFHRFDGPHPAGNVGVQIHHVMPINKGDLVWVAQPQDLVIIGKLFLDGIYDASRIIAVAGSEVKKPAYYRTKLGACVNVLLKNNVLGSNVRVISGNPLTGGEIAADGYLGFYHNQLTVLPEGNHHEFMGWAAPGFGKFSMSRTFFSWICSNKEYKLDTNMHGGERAIVVSGEWDKVLPMDILPEFLIKAILAEDIDKMEQLGIYEIAEEDVALCEFVCTSKLQLQEIVRNGLNLMMKELG